MAMTDEKPVASHKSSEGIYVAIICIMAATFSILIIWPELRWAGDSISQAILFFVIPSIFSFIYFQAKKRRHLIEYNAYLDNIRYGSEGPEAEKELIRRALEKHIE